jgi:DNA polymerase III subunit gamma/tau
MYYLTYRPKTFAELDNTIVRETISNILAAKEYPHAFLFVGQKGTGKTSTARIFAKAVNCLNRKPPSVEPCNTCKNCLSIDTSASPDVIELDAASNRGIDEIKNLIRESAFSPMTCQYRVFIIDEAHMITHDAFNALLKTLEEPPESVIFILATTNEEKVPKTIASRCVKVPFGKAKKEDVFSMLQRIAKQEKLKLDEELLTVIASHSDRSFRDAAKLLEELVMQNKLSADEAKGYLGVRSKQSLMEILQTKPLKDALKWTDEFAQSGGAFKPLIEELLEELRIKLMTKYGVYTDPDEGLFSLSAGEIAQLMKLLHEAYNNLKITPIESIPLEIAIVEFYNQRGKQIK